MFMAAKSSKLQKSSNLKYTLTVLWEFLRKYKFLFYVIIILVALTELISFLDTVFYKYLVDKATLFSQNAITEQAFAKLILLIVFIYLGITLLSGALWYLILYLANRLEANLMSAIERKSFWHILNLSYGFHLNKRTGAVISQFTRGVSKIESLADAVIFTFVPVIFRLVLSVGVIFYFDIPTALTLLCTILLYIFVGVYLIDKQKTPQDKANSAEDLLKHNISDVFYNVETVKYFAKENKTFSNFSKISRWLKEARLKYWSYFSWLVALQTVIVGAGVGIIFYFSFSGYRSGAITLGSIILIYAAVWKILPQLHSLMHGYRTFIRSSVDISSLFILFKEKNDVVDIEKAKKLVVKEGEIEFENVSFDYPQARGASTLTNFDLKIKKGSKIALVGPSGGGKTTVVKLLYRLFDIKKGRILIDGQDISKVTQSSLRSSLSIVPQEPILFDNTVYYNIAYADPKAGREKVWKAIKFARLNKFIDRLQAKEKTIIGERGVKLSGGEKQRVSIARAILANKKVLILDEATSALDSVTEKEIQAHLEELMKGRTSIIIAHRLSTIMKADVIVVLKGGKVVEMGSHEELIQQEKGVYRRMWEIQRG